MLAAFTGLRWGELIALRRRDLDLDAGFVTVRSAAVEIDSKLDGGRPKSLPGVREVGIPEVLVPELREHVRRWAESGSYGRVFKGPNGATPRRSPFNRLWQEAVAAAGIAPEVGLHFHDLRHTGNNLTRGASLKDVMRRLGHASTRAALIYQHADRESEPAILALICATPAHYGAVPQWVLPPRDAPERVTEPGGRRPRSLPVPAAVWANVDR